MSIRALRSDISLGSNDAAFDHLVRLSDTLAATPGPGFNANATQTLLALIALGDEWRAERPVAAGPGYQRVTGCMADSRVKTLLLNDGTLHISGYADSRVAQGMLALLARGLEGVSAAAVSDCRVSSVLARCAVTSLLPPGRFNGFTNMLQLVQDQTRLLLAGETLPMVATAEGSGYTEEVAVLLSGGVDSSVALRLLLEQGLSVRAFYLKIWLEDEIAHLNECPWEEDLGYAQAVCDQLKVPLEAVSLQREYWDEVVSYTFTEAQLGRTPNPDVMCNSRIKFGALSLDCVLAQLMI
jgi:sulfur transfer protein SufE